MTISQTIGSMGEVPSTNDPINFAAEADALLGAALPARITEMNTWATQANALAAALNNIASGAAASIQYTFDTATGDVDPTSGKLRLDNATQNSATTIRANLLDVNEATWTALLDTFDDSTSTIKGYISLQKASDASKWLLFSVSALASPSGYKNITVANIASSAASPFANSDAVLLKFTRNGDKGDTGATGAAGTNGTLLITRSPRTSNTILAAADAQKLIDATSGTYSQTLTAAATLGSGWWAYVGNSGAGYITLDPDGAETITRDGVAHTTWVLWPKEIGLLVCDGTGFYYYPIQKGQIVQTVSSSVSEVIFATGMGYRRRMSMVVENVSVSAHCQFGVSLRVGGANRNRYSRFISITSTSTVTPEADGSGGVYIVGADGLKASASNVDERFVAEIEFHIGETLSSNFGFKTHFRANSTNYNSSNGIAFAGQGANTCIMSNLGDIRLHLSTGTIDTGTFVLKEI